MVKLVNLQPPHEDQYVLGATQLHTALNVQRRCKLPYLLRFNQLLDYLRDPTHFISQS